MDVPKQLLLDGLKHYMMDGVHRSNKVLDIYYMPGSSVAYRHHLYRAAIAGLRYFYIKHRRSQC